MAVVMAGREEDQQSSLSLAHSSCCTVCSCVIVASLPCRPVGQHCMLDLRCTQPGWAADCQRRGSNLDLFSKPLTANPRGVADRDLSHGKRSRAQPANCKRTQLLTAEGRWAQTAVGLSSSSDALRSELLRGSGWLQSLQQAYKCS